MVEVEKKQEVESASVGQSSAPTSSSSANVLGIVSIILGVISFPMVFCGGLCCIPFPILGIILGLVGAYQGKSETGKYDMVSVVGAILNGVAILIVVLTSMLGIGLVALDSLT